MALFYSLLETETQVRQWLKQQGLGRKKISVVIDGIDFDQKVYVAMLERGERLVQYRDRPNAEYPSGDLGGQWFGLPSITDHDLGKVGIGSGLAGRVRHELTVVRSVAVLESTARRMKGHPTERYVGPGGATQIFIPDCGLSCLG